MMKSTFFTATVLALGFFSSFSSATPTAPSSIELESRTFGGNKCKGNQFWYKQRNCCLDNGGPRSPPSPPSGRDCPGDWYWKQEQGCCVPKYQPRDDDPEPQCGKKKWKWKKGSQCCEKDDDDHDDPSPPQPSGRPSQGGGKDDKDCKDDDKKGGKGRDDDDHKKGGKGRDKRAEQAKTHKKAAMKKRVAPLCPYGMEACPIVGLGLPTGSDFECIESQEDIHSCGGCASTGQGQDCTAIPNAWNVACNLGSCAIRSCEPGYTISGQKCVKV